MVPILIILHGLQPPRVRQLAAVAHVPVDAHVPEISFLDAVGDHVHQGHVATHHFKGLVLLHLLSPVSVFSDDICSVKVKKIKKGA